MYRRLLIGMVLVNAVGTPSGGAQGETIELDAKDTLTAVEMNRGDTLRFRLRDGRVFTLELLDTDAAVLEKVTPGGVVYQFRAHVRVDGQPMTLHRYVCCQQCFYEPYVIDGVRIWLDTVRDVFDLIPIRYPHKGNLQCLPRKDARLALQDATLRICPQQTRPWIADERDSLNVADCYNGDDSYLGPYLGRACHVGLDVNHKKGSLLSAPIDFDMQAYFNSLKTGHNNNRWRGIRRWPNGDVWALQSHHMIELLVEQRTPLKVGTPYATTAGVYVGSHEHTHFEFKTGRPRARPTEQPTAVKDDDTRSISVPIDFDDESLQAQDDPEVLHLDPWIVFWQTFEDRKSRQRRIHAAMKPVGPARTGEQVTFSAEGSRPGANDRRLRYFWTFGDGGTGDGPQVANVFARAGVWSVSLLVDDGVALARFTQQIAVSGRQLETPVLVLTAPDEPAFRARPPHSLDVYGRPIESLAHTLSFVARPSCPEPEAKVIALANVGGGVLARSDSPRIEYQSGQRWLSATTTGDGNDQAVQVAVDAAELPPGKYLATVGITCPGATGSPQSFHVRLRVPGKPPLPEVTIDNRSSSFYATPYFWVGHRFCRCPRDRRGFQGFYLTNGSRPVAGEYARFTPDLQAGRYRVAFREETPFRSDTEFDVRVRHGEGEQTIRVKPHRSRLIGEFPFDEGTDGFVELRAEGSTGLVIADAVRFTLTQPASAARRRNRK